MLSTLSALSRFRIFSFRVCVFFLSLSLSRITKKKKKKLFFLFSFCKCFVGKNPFVFFPFFFFWIKKKGDIVFCVCVVFVWKRRRLSSRVASSFLVAVLAISCVLLCSLLFGCLSICCLLILELYTTRGEMCVQGQQKRINTHFSSWGHPIFLCEQIFFSKHEVNKNGKKKKTLKST
jgi:hypothetical protein